MIITKDDRIWLEYHFFPNKFNFEEDCSGYKIEGTFSFSVFFDKPNKGYIINPEDLLKNGEYFIEDEYEISIYIPKNDSEEDNCYKHIKNTDFRIEKLAKEFDLTGEDLHVNSGEFEQTLCIVGLFQENYQINFRDFIQGAFLQFFCDQSYCEKCLRQTNKVSWLRGQYPHGIKGAIESYVDAYKNTRINQKIRNTEGLLGHIAKSKDIDLKKDIKEILYNSNLKSSVAHSKIIFGVFLLKKMVYKFHIDLRKYDL